MRRLLGLLSIAVVAFAVIIVVISWVVPAPATPERPASKPASATPERPASKQGGTWTRPNLASSSKSADGADVAVDVFRELLRICPRTADLLFYASDVTYAWHTDPAVFNYMARTYGWNPQLELQIVLREDIRLPEEMMNFPGVGAAVLGDHAFFDVGAGRRPGVAVSKATSRYACGLPTDSSDTVLIADPWMASLTSRFPPNLTPSNAPRRR